MADHTKKHKFTVSPSHMQFSFLPDEVKQEPIGDSPKPANICKRSLENSDNVLKTKILHQIIVETDPLVRLRTELIMSSDPLMAIAESFKDSPDRNKYEYCTLILDSEGIPASTWMMLNPLSDNDLHVFGEYLLDDLLYLMHKYDMAGAWGCMQLAEFIYKQIMNGCKFKRMTCLESNKTYYYDVINAISDIHDNRQLLPIARARIISKLPSQMISDVIEYNLSSPSDKSKLNKR